MPVHVMSLPVALVPAYYYAVVSLNDGDAMSLITFCLNDGFTVAGIWRQRQRKSATVWAVDLVDHSFTVSTHFDGI